MSVHTCLRGLCSLWLVTLCCCVLWREGDLINSQSDIYVERKMPFTNPSDCALKMDPGGCTFRRKAMACLKRGSEGRAGSVTTSSKRNETGPRTRVTPGATDSSRWQPARNQGAQSQGSGSWLLSVLRMTQKGVDFWGPLGETPEQMVLFPAYNSQNREISEAHPASWPIEPWDNNCHAELLKFW